MDYIQEVKIDDNTVVYRLDLTATDSGRLAMMCREMGLDDSVEAKAESRKREILGERVMLKQVFGLTELSHNDDCAPIVALDGHISIAHTRDTLLLALNRRQAIGIDIEGYRERVLGVREGFLNENERTWLSASDLTSHVVAWTAKEAVFKAVSVRALVKSYRDDIVLEPFKIADDATNLLHCARFGDRTFALHTILDKKEVFTLAIEN